MPDNGLAKRIAPAIRNVIMLSAMLSLVIFSPVLGSLPFNMVFTRLFLSVGFALLSATIFSAVDCRISMSAAYFFSALCINRLTNDGRIDRRPASSKTSCIAVTKGCNPSV